MSTSRESPCEHPIEDFVWNGSHFICPVKIYDKGTVDECGAVLDNPNIKPIDAI